MFFRKDLKHRTMKAFICALASACAAGCGAHEGGENVPVNLKEEVRLMAATDIHHLSETLYDSSSEIFARLMATNDGKLSEKSTEILEALKERAMEEKPDALLLAGDLTFNGELVSLREIADVLAQVEEAGIPVYVIPGNHDINYAGAASYFGSEAVKTEQISPEAFAEVMGPYGYEEALSRDEASLSYAAALADDLWLLTLDANVPEEKGYITAATMSWAEQILEKAQREGIRVVVMSHQNVLIQNSMMYNGYVIHNHEAVEHMLKRYGVSLVMSGHSHLEHTAVSDGLTDICSESLAVYPLQYGMITLGAAGGDFRCEKKKLGILEQEAFDCFAETVVRMVSPIVNEAAEDVAERACMTEYAVALNAACFSGDRQSAQDLADEPGRKLWQQRAGDTFWGIYIENILSEMD